jgi:hypothetical protein
MNKALGRLGIIEGALAQAFRIDRKNLPAFRARLVVLQGGGLLGRKNQVGKGQYIEYGRDEVWRLIFAVELLETGIAPSAILEIVRRQWTEEIARLFEEAVESKSELALAVSMMKGSWSKKLRPIVGLYDPVKGIVLLDQDTAKGTSRSMPKILLNVAERWRDFETALEQEDEDK